MELLYHLALRANWEAALAAGSYRISSIDSTLEEEGFIHCSFAGQVQGTADRFYGGRDDVLLLEIDPERLEAEVRVEAAKPDARGFPHIYGPLPTGAVRSATSVALGDDGLLRTGLAPG
ncbi:MAG TPA: DUF952 domain-containing protein [Acidimicrobiales bacterium]|nr:DUF952 domain-containing protein [Acidimicrobiales bacterium]